MNNLMHNKIKLGSILFFILIALLVIIYISPFCVMFFTSFKTNSDAFTIPVKLLPREWVAENYPAAMATIPYFRYMGNTIFITVLSVMGQLIVTPMVAYSLSKINWKGSKIISGLLMATMMIPITVTMVPLYRIYSKLGLTNTRIGLMIVYLSFSVPYAVWMLVGFFKTVPIGIEEAAKIDGANKVQVFVKVVLPLVMPGIVATAIYTFINAWNEFLYALILINSTDLMTVSVKLRSLQGAEILNWGDMMAASTLVVVPSVIFFMLIQNKIAGGMTEGSVK